FSRSRAGHVDFGATLWDGPWDARRQRAAAREPAWHVAGRALSRMDAPHPLAAEAPAPAAASEHRRELPALALAALGVVYGDIGTSPLYAIKECFVPHRGLTPTPAGCVVPVPVGILGALFMVQRRGTAGVGAVFGPATLVWFVSIAAVGIPRIAAQPAVFAAVNPLHAARFLGSHGYHGFLLLGAVVLCITGGEALYADMGHFGPRPIRLAWYGLVMPALLLNYFGQGALLLERCHLGMDGEVCSAAVASPFYALVPGWFALPMVVIAAAVAVVTSRALISGAFSLTQQAVQLGFVPRVKLVH